MSPALRYIHKDYVGSALFIVHNAQIHVYMYMYVTYVIYMYSTCTS